MSHAHRGFSIETSEEDERLVVRPHGELDLATAPELEQLVVGRLADGGRVTIDLRGLSFMDSSGVRVLVAAHAKTAGDGGELRIVRPAAGSAVDRILVVSGIDGALPLVEAAGP